MCFSTHLQKHSYPSLFLQLVIFILSSCVPRLPSLSDWAVTESSVFFCFQHHGELSLSGGEGGGWRVEWVGTFKGGQVERREEGWGGAEWEESPGCQGVTSLDTTSSPPGNRCDSPPCSPLPPSPLSLTARKQHQDIHTHIKKKNTCGEFYCVAFKFIHYMYSSQNKE